MGSVRAADASDGNSPTDDALVVEALADPAAFDQLYERYHADISHFVRSRVTDIHQAEDIVSQIFLQALRGLPSYRSGSFRGWLYRIARNVIVDSYRRRPQVASGDVMAGCATPDSGPLDVVEAREARDELQRIISKLTRLQQAIIQLRLDGYSGQEIADRLGISLSAVKSAQFRAFEKIRTLMTGSLHQPIDPQELPGDRRR